MIFPIEPKPIETKTETCGKMANLPNPSPNVPLRIELGRFLVKTLDTRPELEEVLRFRYRMFDAEYGMTGDAFDPHGIDADEYDAFCDHLIVKDKETSAIVGTYRLIASSFSSRFYSEKEFDLQPVLSLPGVKLELGRACIDERFRDGSVMNVLWKGLAAYTRAVGAETMFGCSSISTVDPKDIAWIVRYLRESGLFSEELSVDPTEPFRVNLPENAEANYDRALARKKVPALFLAYLKAGARVCGLPALDKDFSCIDFLTMLRTRELNQLFEKRYSI
jgi:putative hemolysin